MDALLLLLGFILFTQFLYAGFYAWRDLLAGQNGFIRAIALFSLGGVLAGSRTIAEVVLQNLDMNTQPYINLLLKLWQAGVYGLVTFSLHLMIQKLRDERKNEEGQVPRSHSGQALVEMALILPILIFILIGVFEVGYALRSYIVLANANREAARFAVRPRVLDYKLPDPGYAKIWTHTLNSIEGQIAFERGGEMLVSRVFVDAGMACPLTGTCNCDQAMRAPFTPTILLNPVLYPTHTARFPATLRAEPQDEASTRQSRVLSPDFYLYLVAQNRRHNCELIQKGVLPVVDDLIVVEMWYEQPQLFGFPLISNPYTDPVPMYTHTVMRRIEAVRSP
jgi:hypothetical protein